MSSSRDDKVPRTTRGTDHDDDDVWVPGHLDRQAAIRIWKKPPMERLDVFRRLAITGITQSFDPDVVAAAYLVFDAVRARNPARAIRDLGLVVAGGAHSFQAQDARQLRDAWLRNLWRSEYSSTLDNPYAAARAMLADFSRYETRRWPRDRDSNDFPLAGAEKTWSDILRRGVHMPGVDQLAKILRKF